MKVFQILDNQVTVIDGEKSYIDTKENFLKDGGTEDIPGALIYDHSQKCCVVNGEFKDFPDAGFDTVIAGIDGLLKAKDARMPKAEEPAVSAQDALRADYEASVRDLTNDYAVACLRGDSEAQESVKQDFANLQAAYKEEMEALE